MYAVKPRIAVFSLTGCQGDQLQLVDLEEVILDVLRHADFTHFPLVQDQKSETEPHYDISFVEGSVTTPEHEALVKAVRSQTTLLIALGSCAATGGINALTGLLPGTTARPVSAIVQVDAALPGCPVDRTELLRAIKDLFLDKDAAIPAHPVCVECKLAGNVCRFDLGKPCLGIITRAGCHASCVSEGATCWGCRGLAPQANLEAARAVFARHGFSDQDLAQLAALHLSAEAPELLKTGGAA